MKKGNMKEIEKMSEILTKRSTSSFAKSIAYYQLTKKMKIDYFIKISLLFMNKNVIL